MKNGDKREVAIAELTHIKTCRLITMLPEQVSAPPQTPSFPHFKAFAPRLLSHATNPLFQFPPPSLRQNSCSLSFYIPNALVLFCFPTGAIGESVIGISFRVVFAAAMPPRRYAFGRADEATHPDSIRATLAEFVSTFIFVFAGEGSVLALGMINSSRCSRSHILP